MDILDSFDEIKIGVAYKLDGKVLDSMPGTYHCNTMTLCVTKSVYSYFVNLGARKRRLVMTFKFNVRPRNPDQYAESVD